MRKFFLMINALLLTAFLGVFLASAFSYKIIPVGMADSEYIKVFIFNSTAVCFILFTPMLISLLKNKDILKKNEKPAQRYWFIARLFVIICAAILLISFAGKTSLWADDFASMNFAGYGNVRQTLFENIRTGRFAELDLWSNPPLFLFFATFWLRIMPYGTMFVKLLNIIFIIIGYFVLGYAARKIQGERTALFATIFAAFSNFLTVCGAYSLRCYGLLFLITVIVIAARLAVKENPTLYNLFFYGISMALLMYTHYFGMFFVLGAGLFSVGELLFKIKGKAMKAFFPFIIAGILILPLIYSFMTKHGSVEVAETWIKPPSSMIGIAVMLGEIFSYDLLTAALFAFTIIVFVLFLIFADKKMGGVRTIRETFLF